MYLYDEGKVTLGYPCLHLEITMLTTLMVIVVEEAIGRRKKDCCVYFFCRTVVATINNWLK